MHMTGMEYDAFLNNCQKFCIRLFFCVRAPLTPRMIFENVDSLPHNAKEIIGRRFIEYILFRPPASERPNLMPIPIDAILLPLWIATVMYTVYTINAPYITKFLLSILLAGPFVRHAKDSGSTLFYWSISYLNAASKTTSIASDGKIYQNSEPKGWFLGMFHSSDNFSLNPVHIQLC
jgi:hypothetical protein